MSIQPRTHEYKHFPPSGEYSHISGMFSSLRTNIGDRRLRLHYLEQGWEYLEEQETSHNTGEVFLSVRRSSVTWVTAEETSIRCRVAKKKIQKIRDYYGSGWLGPCLTRNFVVGKLSQNGPKPVLIFWSSIPCVFCLYFIQGCALLKVVGY